jgi:hypothetical protein
MSVTYFYGVMLKIPLRSFSGKKSEKKTPPPGISLQNFDVCRMLIHFFRSKVRGMVSRKRLEINEPRFGNCEPWPELY